MENMFRAGLEEIGRAAVVLPQDVGPKRASRITDVSDNVAFSGQPLLSQPFEAAGDAQAEKIKRCRDLWWSFPRSNGSSELSWYHRIRIKDSSRA